MQRVHHSTSKTTLVLTPTSGSPGFFGEGSPLDAPTFVTANWANSVQEELIYIVEQGGLTPNLNVNTQVWDALRIVNDDRYVKKIGDTMSGALNIVMSSQASLLNLFAPTAAGLEIGSNTGSCTSFIDFHTGSTVIDFDTRIVGTGGTGVNGEGNLDILSGVITEYASRAGGGTINLTATGNVNNSFSQVLANNQNYSLALTARKNPATYTQIILDAQNTVLTLTATAPTGVINMATGSGQVNVLGSRILGLSPGINATDAVNVSQLHTFPAGAFLFTPIYGSALIVDQDRNSTTTNDFPSGGYATVSLPGLSITVPPGTQYVLVRARVNVNLEGNDGIRLRVGATSATAQVKIIMDAIANLDDEFFEMDGNATFVLPLHTDNSFQWRVFKSEPDSGDPDDVEPYLFVSVKMWLEGFFVPP